MSELVSIVIPLYNYSNYVIELIQSVETQDYDDWEVIIVDDFSTDNPIRTINKYLSDKIFYYRMNKNMGYAFAKNEGIIRSKGKYIAVVDADDILCPCSLSSRANVLARSKYSWVHAKAYEIHGLKPYKTKFKKRKFIKLFNKIKKTGDYSLIWQAIHSQTVMVKREVYEKVGLYEESMRSMSDKEMWARIYFNIGRPEYIDSFVAYYRIHDKQMHKSKEKIRSLPKLKKKLEYFISKRKQGNTEDIRCLK